MPYVGDHVQPPRKRRWDDDDKDEFYRVYGPEKQQGDIYLVNQRSEFAPRKVLPLSKRARIITDDGVHLLDDLSPTPAAHRRRPSLQKLSPSLDQNHPHYENLEGRTLPRISGISLLPCHICHRRPTKKSDLDSFADCQGCHERTCFVCIRQCAGWTAGQAPASDQIDDTLSRSFHMDDADDLPLDEQQPSSPPPQQYDSSYDFARPGIQGRETSGHARLPDANTAANNTHYSRRGGWEMGGHRAMVCSRCCVEKGGQGDVVCLGCLSRMEGA